jgi:hypothetical protein
MKWESDIMTLGAMIDRLKTYDENLSMYLDFALLVPVRLDSYRGYYDHLAINYAIEVDDDGEKNEMTVGKFLHMCEKAVGAYFTGYKGGEFKMNMSTPLWVANYGYSEHTGVIGIEQCTSWDAVIIHTSYIE